MALAREKIYSRADEYLRPKVVRGSYWSHKPQTLLAQLAHHLSWAIVERINNWERPEMFEGLRASFYHWPASNYGKEGHRVNRLITGQKFGADVRTGPLEIVQITF